MTLTYGKAPLLKNGHRQFHFKSKHHQEIAYARPRHPDIETYPRNDVHDRVRKFNKESRRKRPIDGRARQYLNVGPWLKLRILKTSVHITRKGTPPQKAYSILAKHMLKQLAVAEKPRILAPNIKRTKKQLLTIATTEALKEISQSRLAGILEKGLRRRAKHIIYRQTNTGGPLMEFAKTNDALY